MIKIEMSSHVMRDRYERTTRILTEVGLGEEAFTLTDRRHDNAQIVITDKGVVLVKSLTSDKLITMFLADTLKTWAWFKAAGYASIPPRLLKVIKYNELYHAELYKLKR